MPSSKEERLDSETIVDVVCPLGFRVRCTADQWNRISRIKHPPMSGNLDQVIATIRDPDEIRHSVKNRDVLLFHRRLGSRWVSAVVAIHDGHGLLITAYPADKIKQGELAWKK
ncbi:MAG: DUF4258 domain-containing protein [Planctomycetota bacterium]